MKKILGLVALGLMVSAPVFGASTVTYTLELGGNNHAAQLPGGVVPFTSGTTDPGDPGVPIDTGPAGNAPGGILTWAVQVEATGDYGGYPIYGVANMVWDLELRDAANNLVQIGKGSASTQGWFSTINDPTAASSFAYSFDLDPTAAGDVGRVWDPVSANGPHLAQKTYPSTDSFPAGAPNDGSLKGKLVGMGAGYQDFRGSSAVGERPGVGLIGDPTFDHGCYRLLTGPVAEGQINLKDLPNGTYTLKLLAGNGNNILRGDASYYCNQDEAGNFAVKADTVNGDTIKFIISNAVQPCDPVPALASVASVRTHGANGDWGLVLNTAGAATTEPRSWVNGSPRIVLTYSAPIDGTPVSTLGTAVKTNDTTVTVSGLGTPVDGSCMSLTVSGLVCKQNGSTPVPAATVKVLCVFCDVTGGGVNAGDIGQVKLASGKPISASNFTKDVNCDGNLNAGDIGQTKLRSAKVTPDPCSN